VTGRGWAVLTAALACLVSGRLLGLEDLYLVGAGLLAALAVAAGYVRIVRPDLGATRRILPPRVHAGANSRVELTLTNRGRNRSPVLTARDPFDRGARWARFLVAPLASGEVARAAYRLPTDQRGIYDLGPLQVGLSDPFGLAASVVQAAPRTQLTVYPRIDVVAPPPSGHGDDPLAGADHPRAMSGGGEDFYALRPYVRGDDLRRVHWPSTAKLDELMLRQDEMPWQGRSLLLLDTRSSVCRPAALELLVSATASLVAANNRHDGLQRLVTTGGYDSRLGAGTSHAESILEHLAGVRTSEGQLLTALGTIRRSHGGGALVMLTTANASGAELAALATLRTWFSSLTLVLAERSAWGSGGGPLTAVPQAVRVARVTADVPFSAAWRTVAGAPDSRRPRPGRSPAGSTP